MNGIRNKVAELGGDVFIVIEQEFSYASAEAYDCTRQDENNTQ